jgi:hypothetical protein
VIGTKSAVQRRAQQQEQHAHYLAQLRSHGVEAPHMDVAWQDYARHAIWIFLFALCPEELQPEELCMLNAERVSAAIIDLDTLALLEAS